VKRLISSAVLIAAIVIIIYALPIWMYTCVVIILIAQALNEFFTIVGKKERVYLYRYSGIAMGSAIPIMAHLSYGQSQHGFEPFLIVLFSLFIFVIQFTRANNEKALTAVSITLLAILYISWFFSFLVKIRFLPNGADFAAILLLIAKSGDIGSYLIGKNFGRKKLVPKISPNKTVEGTLGGVFFSVTAALLCRNLAPEISTWHFLIIGIIVGVLAQIGDLSESLIKRSCQVKDAGNIFPGLGGVLDAIDSLLFTSPMYYFYLKAFIL